MNGPNNRFYEMVDFNPGDEIDIYKKPIYGPQQQLPVYSPDNRYQNWDSQRSYLPPPNNIYQNWDSQRPCPSIDNIPPQRPCPSMDNCNIPLQRPCPPIDNCNIPQQRPCPHVDNCNIPPQRPYQPIDNCNIPSQRPCPLAENEYIHNNQDCCNIPFQMDELDPNCTDIDSSVCDQPRSEINHEHNPLTDISDMEILNFLLKRQNLDKRKIISTIQRMKLIRIKEMIMNQFYEQNPNVRLRKFADQYIIFSNWNKTNFVITEDELESFFAKYWKQY